MRRLICILFSLAFVISAASGVSAQKYPLGSGDVAVKVEYFRFMDSSLRDTNAGDGVYVGVEAYKQLFLRNLYLGVEVGWAGTSGTFTVDDTFFTVQLDTDINYVPIEFNAKYVFPVHPCLTLDIGGGFSYNYFGIDQTLRFLNMTESASTSGWVFGGQFFADLNYKFQNYFVGVGVKYQLTEDLDIDLSRSGTSPDNFRAGVQVGLMF